ncbi:TPA: hypothetical protein ACPZZY_000586, partial [Enterobacter hormaechei subsp. xiangfangensis]
AGNLEFSYPKWAGEPMYDHEKRLGKSSQQPKNEEKKGDGESDQGGAGKRDGVPPVGVPVDADLSGGDATSLNGPAGGNVVKFPRQKASFKSVAPDDEELEDNYQEYAGCMEQNTYCEPSQADFEKAEASLYGGVIV